jgi:hypothetical protein
MRLSKANPKILASHHDYQDGSLNDIISGSPVSQDKYKYSL